MQIPNKRQALKNLLIDLNLRRNAKSANALRMFELALTQL